MVKEERPLTTEQKITVIAGFVLLSWVPVYLIWKFFEIWF